jgi:ribosome-binding factor A
MKRDTRPCRDRAQRQLCAQVGQAVDLALGASEDPLLQGCWVVDVRPAPTQSRLRVRVQTADAIEIPLLEQRLERATAWLRSEVGVAISRRRVPNLLVVWAGPQA